MRSEPVEQVAVRVAMEATREGPALLHWTWPERSLQSASLLQSSLAPRTACFLSTHPLPKVGVRVCIPLSKAARAGGLLCMSAFRRWKESWPPLTFTPPCSCVCLLWPFQVGKCLVSRCQSTPVPGQGPHHTLVTLGLAHLGSHHQSLRVNRAVDSGLEPALEQMARPPLWRCCLGKVLLGEPQLWIQR